MVDVVQLVRASDCGSECRGFESHLPPQSEQRKLLVFLCVFFENPTILFAPKITILVENQQNSLNSLSFKQLDENFNILIDKFDINLGITIAKFDINQKNIIT